MQKSLQLRSSKEDEWLRKRRSSGTSTLIENSINIKRNVNVCKTTTKEENRQKSFDYNPNSSSDFLPCQMLYQAESGIVKVTWKCKQKTNIISEGSGQTGILDGKLKYYDRFKVTSTKCQRIQRKSHTSVKTPNSRSLENYYINQKHCLSDSSIFKLNDLLRKRKTRRKQGFYDKTSDWFARRNSDQERNMKRKYNLEITFSPEASSEKSEMLATSSSSVNISFKKFDAYSSFRHIIRKKQQNMSQDYKNYQISNSELKQMASQQHQNTLSYSLCPMVDESKFIKISKIKKKKREIGRINPINSKSDKKVFKKVWSHGVVSQNVSILNELIDYWKNIKCYLAHTSSTWIDNYLSKSGLCNSSKTEIKTKAQYKRTNTSNIKKDAISRNEKNKCCLKSLHKGISKENCYPTKCSKSNIKFSNKEPLDYNRPKAKDIDEINGYSKREKKKLNAVHGQSSIILHRGQYSYVRNKRRQNENNSNYEKTRLHNQSTHTVHSQFKNNQKKLRNSKYRNRCNKMKSVDGTQKLETVKKNISKIDISALAQRRSRTSLKRNNIMGPRIHEYQIFLNQFKSMSESTINDRKEKYYDYVKSKHSKAKKANLKSQSKSSSKNNIKCNCESKNCHNLGLFCIPRNLISLVKSLSNIQCNKFMKRVNACVHELFYNESEQMSGRIKNISPVSKDVGTGGIVQNTSKSMDCTGLLSCLDQANDTDKSPGLNKAINTEKLAYLEKLTSSSKPPCLDKAINSDKSTYVDKATSDSSLVRNRSKSVTISVLPQKHSKVTDCECLVKTATKTTDGNDLLKKTSKTTDCQGLSQSCDICTNYPIEDIRGRSKSTSNKGLFEMSNKACEAISLSNRSTECTGLVITHTKSISCKRNKQLAIQTSSKLINYKDFCNHKNCNVKIQCTISTSYTELSKCLKHQAMLEKSQKRPKSRSKYTSKKLQTTDHYEDCICDTDADKKYYKSKSLENNKKGSKCKLLKLRNICNWNSKQAYYKENKKFEGIALTVRPRSSTNNNLTKKKPTGSKQNKKHLKRSRSMDSKRKRNYRKYPRTSKKSDKTSKNKMEGITLEVRKYSKDKLTRKKSIGFAQTKKQSKRSESRYVKKNRANCECKTKEISIFDPKCCRMLLLDRKMNNLNLKKTSGNYLSKPAKHNVASTRKSKVSHQSVNTSVQKHQKSKSEGFVTNIQSKIECKENSSTQYNIKPCAADCKIFKKESKATQKLEPIKKLKSTKTVVNENGSCAGKVPNGGNLYLCTNSTSLHKKAHLSKTESKNKRSSVCCCKDHIKPAKIEQATSSKTENQKCKSTEASKLKCCKRNSSTQYNIIPCAPNCKKSKIESKTTQKLKQILRKIKINTCMSINATNRSRPKKVSSKEYPKCTDPTFIHAKAHLRENKPKKKGFSMCCCKDANNSISNQRCCCIYQLPSYYRTYLRLLRLWRNVVGKTVLGFTCGCWSPVALNRKSKGA